MGNKMWGGRFADGPDAIMEAINVSIDFDQRLARQDIAGSRAHAQMLSDSGIITSDDLAEILNGLDQVEQELVRAHAV